MKTYNHSYYNLFPAFDKVMPRKSNISDICDMSSNPCETHNRSGVHRLHDRKKECFKSVNLLLSSTFFHS